MAIQEAPFLAITGFVTIALGLVLLIIAYQQALSKNFKNHKNLMLAAAVVNAAFLVQYITRFVTGNETHFSGPETIRNFVYLPILSVHILTAIITIGLVILHLKRSLANELQAQGGVPYFDKDYRSDHRSFGRITFYFWIISFVGGIIIFLMLYVLF